MDFLTVNGIRLHYRFDGQRDAPVVMLAHSLAADLAMWDAQVPALTGAGFRVLRYDGRGHGSSDAPAGAYSLEDLAADATGLMDGLGLESVHFCGLSMGGMVAQMLGALHGGRLRSLVLCSTSPGPMARRTWDERLATVRSGGMAAVAEATLGRWFTAHGLESMGEEVEKIRRMILATPVDGFCGCAQAIQEMDLRDLLEKITARTLIVVGEEDAGTPVAVSRSIQQRVSGSRLEIVPAASHLLVIEKKELFNRLLLGFLGEPQ